MQNIESLKQVLDQFECFVFDCDGVLYAGAEPIGRALDVVSHLESLGKKVFFVSNSSGRTREQMVEKLAKVGLKSARPEQMYGSAYVSACYLKRHHPEVAKVRVVGMNSICEELARQGIQSTGGENPESDVGLNINDF